MSDDGYGGGPVDDFDYEGPGFNDDAFVRFSPSLPSFFFIPRSLGRRLRPAREPRWYG